MPKVDFYITEENRLLLACRLIEKAYRNRHRVYIHMENQAEAHKLDELLWTYRDDSFIPHNIYGDGPDPAPPIQIGFNVESITHRDILINLHPSVPSFYLQFQRVLEIVSNQATIQEQCREHFKFYRNKNCDISTHKLQLVE